VAHIVKHFVEQNLAGASFKQAELDGAVFENCQLAGANFRAADLSGAVFERCRLYDADTEQHADFQFANLREVRFEHCDLTTVNLSRVRAYGLVLTHCQAQGLDLSTSDFRLPIGRVSEVVSFTMTHTNFAYGDLSNNFLKGCELSDCRLVEALLHNTVLDDALLTGTDLCNVQGRGLSLKGVDLRRARFNNLDPRVLDLTGVRISAAQALWLLEPLEIRVEADHDG